MSEDAGSDAEARVGQAEQLLEEARDRGARFVARAFARAREEAEDIWAEAKSLNSARRS